MPVVSCHLRASFWNRKSIDELGSLTDDDVQLSLIVRSGAHALWGDVGKPIEFVAEIVKARIHGLRAGAVAVAVAGLIIWLILLWLIAGERFEFFDLVPKPELERLCRFQVHHNVHFDLAYDSIQ